MCLLVCFAICLAVCLAAENGPYTLSKELTLKDNPYGWDTNANVIYVDQPINTGFSWSDVSSMWLGFRAKGLVAVEGLAAGLRAWERGFQVFFVDQPINTGFSCSDVSNMQQHSSSGEGCSCASAHEL